MTRAQVPGNPLGSPPLQPVWQPAWQLALLGLLESTPAPRVCATPDIAHLLRQVRPRATADTLHGAIKGLVHAGALQKVSRGLYLNRRARPSVEVAEAASHIRAGAVVSLETVLGECGFLNNPTRLVTAVLPQRPGQVPRVGGVTTSGGLGFRFHALALRFFANSPAEAHLLLQAGRHCEMAKPEVAVLHWLYLWRSPRSSISPPPQDVDFSVLDLELLDRLALRWGLDTTLEAWMSEVSARGDIQEPSPVRATIATEQRHRAQEARTRLLARHLEKTKAELVGQTCPEPPAG